MKKLLLVSIALNCVLGTVLFIFFSSSKKVISSKVGGKILHKIAIFAPATHTAMDEITEGFKKYLSKEGQATYEFDLYNGNGNPTLIHAQAEELVKRDYDLIVTIGSTCSKVTKETMDKRKKYTPLVFCAVSDPLSLHLVDRLEASGNNVTGVTIASNFEEQIKLLKFFKPSLSKVVLVYNPQEHASFQKDRDLLEGLLQKMEATLVSVEISNANEIPQKVPTFLPNADVVFIFTDHTVCTGIDSLVKLCNQYRVPLYASTLSVAQRGAALSYGVYEKDHGIEAAKKVLTILEDHQQPSQVPISAVTTYQLIINKEELLSQNLFIDPLMLELLAKSHVLE